MTADRVNAFSLLSPANARLLLGLILMVGLGLRLNNIGFGLPAMYDPDEPLFVIKAFQLIDHHTLNPGWFGHPGTTTIYLLAAIDALVAGVGLGSGHFRDLPHFAAAVYDQPSLIFIPSRLAMVAIACATIWLSHAIGRRLFGREVGLLAAALLALNGLHVAWSQVIRTDIHCSLFMLASLFFAVRAAQDGSLRDFGVAGLFAGFAMATKWPGGSILFAVGGAAAHCWKEDRRATRFVQPMLAAGLATIAGLFLGSPYILLDWRQVLSDVGGEVASGHLGHSGHGFLGNLSWYLTRQVAGTMGWIGLLLVVAGLMLMLRDRIARATLLPAAVVFLVLIAAQQQTWSRWITPVLPMLCIAVAFATVAGVRWLAAQGPRRSRRAVALLLPMVVLIPSIAGAAAGARQRADDVRDRASAWAMAHIPPGRTVVVEHLALDLRPQPWRILFPIGTAGCIDGRNILKRGVKVESVQKARGKSAIVDLGNVAPDKLATCDADYAILTYYDLYRAEAASFHSQIDSYHRLIGAGRTVATFTAPSDIAGWPAARIVELHPAAGGKSVASR